MSEVIEIFGYHGTSSTKAVNILADGFRQSDNDYDWLGTGIYFFQDAPLRAKQWATEQHPDNPAVIRALIRLENCIDLFDITWQPVLRNLYNSFVEQYQRTNRPLPKQNPDRSKAHRLDCAFFNYAVKFVSLYGQKVDSVRSVFIEGDRLFPDSAILSWLMLRSQLETPH